MKKSHGGKREGAGKPALCGKPMKRVNVTLDEETIEYLKSLADGNLSAGIRESASEAKWAEEYYKKWQKCLEGKDET